MHKNSFTLNKILLFRKNIFTLNKILLFQSRTPIRIFLKVNNLRSITKLDLCRNPCQWQWIKGTSIKLAEMGGPVSSILFRKWFLIRSTNGELRLKKTLLVWKTLISIRSGRQMHLHKTDQEEESILQN